jgi:hypothetical protein
MIAMNWRAGLSCVAAIAAGSFAFAACGSDSPTAAVNNGQDAGGSGTDSGGVGNDSGGTRVDSGGFIADAGPDASPCPTGKVACGMVCVDTTNDVNNCGACGFQCSIQAPSTVECASSHCIATLASIPGTLGNVLVDSSFVYGINSITKNAVKVPIGGGPPVMMLTGQADGPLVAIDVASMYWYGGVGQMWFAGLDGSSPRVLSSKIGTPVSGAFADANGIYFADGSQIFMLDLRGGDPIVLANAGPGFDIQGFTHDATSFYFTDSGGNVSSVPRAGGTPTKLAFGQVQPNVIAVSTTDVYYFAGDNVSLQDSVWKVPITGGGWTMLSTTVTPFRVDGPFLIGAEYQVGLVKIPLVGGSNMILSTSTTATPQAIDGTSIYWSESSGNGLAKVMKLWPK